MTQTKQETNIDQKLNNFFNKPFVKYFIPGLIWGASIIVCIQGVNKIMNQEEYYNGKEYPVIDSLITEIKSNNKTTIKTKMEDTFGGAKYVEVEYTFLDTIENDVFYISLREGSGYDSHILELVQEFPDANPIKPNLVNELHITSYEDQKFRLYAKGVKLFHEKKLPDKPPLIEEFRDVLNKTYDSMKYY